MPAIPDFTPLPVDPAQFALGADLARQALDGPWNRARAISVLAGFATELASIGAAVDVTEAAAFAHAGGTLLGSIWHDCFTAEDAR